MIMALGKRVGVSVKVDPVNGNRIVLKRNLLVEVL
jgi:hypothetical protein